VDNALRGTSVPAVPRPDAAGDRGEPDPSDELGPHSTNTQAVPAPHGSPMIQEGEAETPTGDLATAEPAPQPLGTESQNAPNTSVESPSLGPAYAILRAIVGDRMPDGPLGADSVPASVLALPVALATEAFLHHVGKCRDPRRCSYAPPSLQPFRRPEAIRRAKDQVLKVLWTHPNSELVSSVRRYILQKNRELPRCLCRAYRAGMAPAVGFQKEGTLAFQNLAPRTCPPT
jgi:hypothetical protein